MWVAMSKLWEIGWNSRGVVCTSAGKGLPCRTCHSLHFPSLPATDHGLHLTLKACTPNKATRVMNGKSRNSVASWLASKLLRSAQVASVFTLHRLVCISLLYVALRNCVFLSWFIPSCVFLKFVHPSYPINL
jgi:hypothetical protein